MHRFFVAPEALAGGETVALGGAAAHQIARVLRLRPGERVVLLDGGGDEWVVRLTAVAPAAVVAAVEQRQAGRGEPALRLTLFQAPLKGDHMDYVLQKGVEVGVAAFAPVLTERTIARAVDDRKLDRWRRIAREAAEQSGRAVIPAVAPPRPLAAALAAATQAFETARTDWLPTPPILGGFAEADVREVPPELGGLRGARTPLLALWEEEHAHGLAAALASLPRPLTALGVLVGPEGGLTPAEVAAARAAGATPVTLGRRILRAETAGLVAAAIALYAAGDLGASR